MIVEMDQWGGIGINSNNEKPIKPWNIPECNDYFHSKTTGKGNNAVLMGRKTWTALCNNGKKPFVGRDNIILSTHLKQLDYQYNPNTHIKTLKNINYSHCRNPHKEDREDQYLCNFEKIKNYDEIWVIGGDQIFETMYLMGLINQIHITTIKKIYNCNKLFHVQTLFCKSISPSQTFKTNDGIEYYRGIYKAYDHH